jgi:Na+-transporting methylmalonyl-CoA/oxaloacetate decarboxylase gamma subunit
MLVWLLVLLLLISVMYVIYKFSFFSGDKEFKHKDEHYTFKI